MCYSVSIKVFSSLHLESVYHQIRILENDQSYTAFEANGELYQFTQVPAAFQGTINNFIKANDLKDTYAHVENNACGLMA